MKYLTLFLIALLSLSCEKTDVSLGCDIEIQHNEKKWKLERCSLMNLPNNRWMLSLTAKGIIHRKIKHTEAIIFNNLPSAPGIYPLEFGITGNWGASYPVQIQLNEIHWDVMIEHRALDEKANNYIRIDSFDPQTGLIEGSFHTEWLKTDPREGGPDNQTIACKAFALILSE
ncbi:MAG: hypothetical protein AB8H47_17500 [Bacteroidia bacterium]